MDLAFDIRGLDQEEVNFIEPALDKYLFDQNITYDELHCIDGVCTITNPSSVPSVSISQILAVQQSIPTMAAAIAADKLVRSNRGLPNQGIKAIAILLSLLIAMPTYAMTQPVFGPNGQPSTGVYPFMFSNQGSTEGNFSGPIAVNGTVSDLLVIVDVAPGVGNSLVFKFRDAGADTSLGCTIQDNNTSCTSTAAATVAAGDIINWRSTPTGTPAASNVSLSASFTGTTDGEAAILGLTNGTVSTGATTYYSPIGGAGVSTVGGATTTMPSAGTIDDLYCSSQGSPGAGNSYTLTVYKNGVATGITSSISGTNTSCTPDTTHSASYNAGDSIAIEVVPAGPPTARILKWGLRFRPTTNGESPLFNRITTSSNTGTTRYSSIRGDNTSTAANDNTATSTASIAFQLKNFYTAYQTGAPTAGTSRTVTVRRNTADTSITALIDSSTSGAWQTDLSHTQNYSVNDTIGYSYTHAGSPPTSIVLALAATAYVAPSVSVSNTAFWQWQNF